MTNGSFLTPGTAKHTGLSVILAATIGVILFTAGIMSAIFAALLILSIRIMLYVERHAIADDLDCDCLHKERVLEAAKANGVNCVERHNWCPHTECCAINADRVRKG